MGTQNKLTLMAGIFYSRLSIRVMDFPICLYREIISVSTHVLRERAPLPVMTFTDYCYMDAYEWLSDGGKAV